jgi:hypothetical protein
MQLTGVQAWAEEVCAVKSAVMPMAIDSNTFFIVKGI